MENALNVGLITIFYMADMLLQPILAKNASYFSSFVAVFSNLSYAGILTDFGGTLSFTRPSSK